MSAGDLMPVYPDKVCPVCGETFTPRHKRQIYDKDYCRVKASRERRRREAPLDKDGLLTEIRKLDAETANDIEKIAEKAGNQIAEHILLVCWRAMHRMALRNAKMVLLESGQVRPGKNAK